MVRRQPLADGTRSLAVVRKRERSFDLGSPRVRESQSLFVHRECRVFPEVDAIVRHRLLIWDDLPARPHAPAVPLSGARDFRDGIVAPLQI